MSDDRWNVDTIAEFDIDLAVKSEFNDAVFRLATGEKRGLSYAAPIREFILELVAEIEHLQTEVIRLQAHADLDNAMLATFNNIVNLDEGWFE